MEHFWNDPRQMHQICVDSYDDGILSGWLHTPLREGLRFSSLTQLLIGLEELLNDRKLPQSFTQPRRFGSVPEQVFPLSPSPLRPRGKLATFEVNIRYRQHSSWQGMLHWKESSAEENFRSVLELVMLIDSALRAA